MAFLRTLFNSYIDRKSEEIIGKHHKNNLIVHKLELPGYRFVDVYNAITEYVKSYSELVVIETEQAELLNDILHLPNPVWADRIITKASKKVWQIGPNDEEFYPLDSFWFLPSEDDDQRFILRLKFDERNGKTYLELASSTTEIGKLALKEITESSTKNSIYRNRVLHLSYEAATKDEYGDVENPETLQVVFSLSESVTDEDIILSSEHLEMIQRNILDFEKRREILKHNGVPTHRGVLFHGPPGTGKTYACRYICHKLKDTTSIFASGKAVGNVVSLFSLARLLQPSIIFIEDADMMFSSRETNLYSTTLGELMDQMDGLKGEEDISVVMTTNAIDRMEAALKDRPGRISQCIYVGEPKSDLREKYLIHLLKDYDLKGVKMSILVDESEGTTQAFLKEWVFRSVQMATERLNGLDQKINLTNADFKKALNEMKRAHGEVGQKIVGFITPR